MGFNTGVIIMNDATHEIQENAKEFVEQLIRVMGSGRIDPNRTNIRAGCHCNAANVFHVNHADNTVIAAIGGNHATILASTFNGGKHYQQEDKVRLLKLWANEMGFDIRKKSK